MKRIFYLVTCAFIVSCSNAPKERENEVAINDAPDTTVNLHPELDTTPTTETDEPVSETVNVSNSTELDESIDEYGKYMVDYMKFIKKGKAGDVTAMLDAAQLMAKAEPVHKRLDEAKGEFTAKQLAKFMRIQAKMMEEMQ